MDQGKIELLAPAGSYEAFLAAMEAGADAVYVGGNRFGARAYAKNFTKEELLLAIDYAHLMKKKVYMTVNTLMKDEELKELPAFLEPYYLAGLDAVIVQDLGAISVIKNSFPLLEIHASTQMTITSIEGVRLMEGMGITQVVPARELSLVEIRNITKQSDIKIECFVHGAICYCYSGKCFFSSLIGGRSGNRGRCAQPCRLPYHVINDHQEMNTKDEQYILSLKDMCTIELIPQLIEAGIASFKIEGRMKRPEYVAGVTSMYRKYIDLYETLQDKKDYRVDPKDLKELENLYTRSGSSKGYYLQKNGRSMITLHKPNYETEAEQLQELGEQYLNRVHRLPIRAVITLKSKQPTKLELFCGKIHTETIGDIAQPALKRPLEKEQVIKQLKKTGNTFFELNDVQVICNDTVFMPVSSLNELRRMAIEELSEELLKTYRRNQNKSTSTVVYLDEKKNNNTKTSPCKVTAYAETIENVRSLSMIEGLDRLYLSYADLEELDQAIKIAVQYGKEIYLTLPSIYRENYLGKKDRLKRFLQCPEISGVAVPNYEWLHILQEASYQGEILSDYDLYMMNQKAREELSDLGCSQFTMPLELNEKEMWKMDRSHCELIIYGYLPMMVTSQCITKTIQECRKQEQKNISLIDRYHKKLHVKNCCSECYNVIYNSVPLSLLHELDTIKSMGFESLRLQFTNESPEDVKRITEYLITMLHQPDHGQTLPFVEYTKGHFSRGVE